MTGDDLLCIECRYNLRGLARDGLCPECGAPAELSFLHRDLDRSGRGVPLRLADARWVRSLANACTALFLVGLWKLWLGVFILQPLGFNPPISIRIGMFLLGELAAWAAVWRLARREPGAPARRDLWLRHAARAAVTATMLLMPVMIGLTLVGQIRQVMSWPLWGARVLGSAATAGPTFFLLSRLARRAEAPRLARAALALAWLAPAVTLLQLVPGLREF